MSPRLGLQPQGAFENRLRFAFMNVLSEIVPDADRELQRDVLPPYIALADHLAATDGQEYWRSLEGLRTVTARRPQIEASARGDLSDRMLTLLDLQDALLGALTAWAARYHLHRDDWPLEHVLKALDYAHRLERGVQIGMVGLSYGFWRPHVDVPALDEYSAGFESREHYIERMKDRINAYADAVEALCQEAGWTTPPAKQKPREHLVWLVRHHCLRHKYEAIAKGTGKSKSTIADEVPPLARMLPLTLRPARGRNSTVSSDA